MLLRIFARNCRSSRSSTLGVCRSHKWHTTTTTATTESPPTATPEPSTTSIPLSNALLRPLPPPSSSPNHNSLPTFLAHAKHTSLSPKSTTYIGTHYEYLCQLSLRRLGFTLHRIGGRSDAGIDLLGIWSLPSLPYPLRVIVQCKALKAKARPNIVRELEGAFSGAPEGWRGEGVVGVLVTGREASRGVREAVRRFGRPVVVVMLEKLEEEEEEEEEGRGRGRVRQVLWNEKVASSGVQGMGVQVRYLPGVGEGDEDEEGDVDTEVVLTWKGEVWEPEVENGE